MSDEHVPWIQSSFTGDHWQPGCSCGWRGSLTIDIPGAQARNREHLALAASSAVPVPTPTEKARDAD